MKSSLVQIFKSYILFVLVSMLGLFRMGFMLWKMPRVLETGGAVFVLLQGLRFDLTTLSILSIFPLLATPLFASFSQVWLKWQKFLVIYFTACFLLLLFMEFATPSFIDEFDQRPNFIFVEYLQYPREVFSTLMSAYAFALTGSLFATVLAGKFFYQLLNKSIADTPI